LKEGGTGGKKKKEGRRGLLLCLYSVFPDLTVTEKGKGRGAEENKKEKDAHLL